MSVADTSDRVAGSTGVTGVIAIIYCLFGLGFLGVIASGATLAGFHLRWVDAWFPLLMAAGGIGTLRRTRWGRWLSYVISAPFLPGVPVGTLIGGFMIWHLTRYRREFTRWL